MRWAKWITFCLFVVLASGSVIAPMLYGPLSEPRFAPPLNALLSIGTSGIVAFIFYYVVNVGLERQRANMVRLGAARTYKDAKRNIALAIIHASQKGGRNDLSADTETINLILTTNGFKTTFEGGREADEGYYAFENQMSERTPEFDEIIFNLNSMARAFSRLTDSVHVADQNTYDFFVRLDGIVRRIERNGAGYDESKHLCSFIWEIFTGWNFVTGDYGGDPIEKALEKLKAPKV